VRTSISLSKVLSRANAASEALATAVSGIALGAARLVTTFWSDVQRRRWLRAVLAGFHFPVDVSLLVLGRLAAAVQTLLWLEPAGRRLTLDEQAVFAPIFAGSVRLDRVLVKEGFIGILGVSGRAFTLGRFIYSPKPLPRDVLLHELVHVWQFEREGLGYLSRAIWAQGPGGGYDHITPRKAGRTFVQLNPEQQAQWVQDLFRAGKLWGVEGQAVLSHLQTRDLPVSRPL